MGTARATPVRRGALASGVADITPSRMPRAARALVGFDANLLRACQLRLGMTIALGQAQVRGACVAGACGPAQRPEARSGHNCIALSQPCQASCDPPPPRLTGHSDAGGRAASEVGSAQSGVGGGGNLMWRLLWGGPPTPLAIVRRLPAPRLGAPSSATSPRRQHRASAARDHRPGLGAQSLRQGRRAGSSTTCCGSARQWHPAP